MKHPNKIPFEGTLTKLDQPSDKAPNGARGHRVLLTREAAEEAIPSLIGMAVGFVKTWDNHDARQKCGVITEAWITGDDLRIKGYIYGRDFPEVTVAMAKPDAALGMSYEMCDARVRDMREEIWTLTQVTFTGAAILLADKAAYRSTTVNLSAAEERFTGNLSFEAEGTVTLVDR